MRARAPAYRTAAGTLLALALCLPPSPARAERGAVTLEVGAGADTTFLPHPYEDASDPADPGDAVRPPTTAVGAAASLQLRYAFTHDLELGLATGLEPTRTQWHPLVRVQGHLGYTDHQYHLTWVQPFVRWYVAGYTWRWYAQLGAGWARRAYWAFDHCIVAVGDNQCRSVAPEGLYPLTYDDLLVELAPGLEYVWDKTAVGLRLRTAVHLGPDVAWRVALEVHGSWSWYP